MCGVCRRMIDNLHVRMGLAKTCRKLTACWVVIGKQFDSRCPEFFNSLAGLFSQPNGVKYDNGRGVWQCFAKVGPK